MIENIHQTRLENGLVILTDRMPSVRSVTLGFFYRIGARNEPTKFNGISHFIEHTVFKGTSRRSALEIAVEQDRLGGNLDAFTTHEETGFAIKVIDDQLEKAFDLLADMLLNPVFGQKDLESEQRVIIEEMKMTDDSPEEFLGEIFSRAFFPRSSLGLPIAGTPESVLTFGHELTRTYHEQNFHPGNLVIVAAGNIGHDCFVEMATAKLSAVSSQWAQHEGAADAREGWLHNSRQDGDVTMAAPILIHQKPDLEQAHLIIATPIVSAKDERRYAADLLANIIGGGTSSRLWQKIREEHGLAYSVGASTAMYRDCGVFSIFAGTSPEQTSEVVDIAISQWRNLVKNGMSKDELDLAKHQARASILLSLEDSAARAAALAQSEMLHGRQISVEETLAKIDAVTVEDLAAISNEFFQTESVAFAALGNLDGLVVDRNRLAIG
jgi:predicted Zn-dependent peptidase